MVSHGHTVFSYLVCIPKSFCIKNPSCIEDVLAHLDPHQAIYQGENTLRYKEAEGPDNQILL